MRNMSELNEALERISGVLGFGLAYKDGKVVGSAEGALTTDLGLTIPILPKATYVCQNDTVGVGFDVIGDLSLLAGYFGKTGTVSIYVLDKARLESGEIGDLLTPDMKLIDVIKKLRGLIVLSFYQKNGEWKPLSLPV